GGTLIFVSHDRYFVDRLATKVIDVGGGAAVPYPGGYEAFLWSREQGLPHQSPPDERGPAKARDLPRRNPPGKPKPATAQDPPRRPADYAERKRLEAEQRKKDKARRALQQRISDLETRIAEHEKAIKDLEKKMAADGFYGRPEAAQPVIDEHQALMWKVGELLSQWEMLSAEADENG